MTVRTALLQGTALLDEAHVAAPRLTAEVLLSHALDKDRVWLYGHSEEELSELAWIHYGRYLHERLNGKPTQYITKRQEFYGREFHVSPAVLIPRPETEHVVETALRFIEADTCIVDVGCGSGAIAITLSLERRARVIGTDISPVALKVARANAERLGATVTFLAADVLAALRPASFDLVVSNPPYVSDADRTCVQREIRDWEPHVAVFSGPTGNEVYARLIADSACVLRPGGRIVLELGYRSLSAVEAMLEERWTEVESVPDLAGIPRVLTARLTR